MTRNASSAEFSWRDGFDDGADGGTISGGVSPRLSASTSSLLAGDTDGNRSPDVQIAFRPAFDRPGQHAFNVTVLACALAYAALAPILLVPGAAFFAVRYLVHKHNLLCLHLDNVAGARAFASSGASSRRRCRCSGRVRSSPVPRLRRMRVRSCRF